jgi:hypothetical protein
VFSVRIRRHCKGSAIAETGPALLLLLILIVFPVIDLLYMGCSFGFAWFLHNTEIRELSVRAPDVSQAQIILAKVDNDFMTNSFGMAGFMGINSANQAQKILHANPSYTPPSATAPNGQVSLATSVVIRPWLYIPFFMKVPGLNTDLTFSFASVKPQEENGKN